MHMTPEIKQVYYQLLENNQELVSISAKAIALGIAGIEQVKEVAQRAKLYKRIVDVFPEDSHVGNDLLSRESESVFLPLALLCPHLEWTRPVLLGVGADNSDAVEDEETKRSSSSSCGGVRDDRRGKRQLRCWRTQRSQSILYIIHLSFNPM